MRTSRMVAAGVVVAGAGLAALVPVLPAVAQSSPPVNGIHLVQPATVAARGAVVFTKLDVICPRHDQFSVSVYITERSGRFVAAGGGSSVQGIPCTGKFQTVKVSVTPGDVGGGYYPFSKGVAYATAQLNFYDPNNQYFSSATKGTLRIVG